jgi:hypothetical protein
MNESGNELSEYVEVMGSLSKRFIRSDNLGYYLKTEDHALFKQKMMEAIAVIDDLLGPGNQYYANIVHSANTNSGGFIGGISYAGVQDVRGIILAAQKQIDRKRNAPAKSPPQSNDFFVAEQRLSQLRRIRSTTFDLARLVRLCEELNVAHTNRSYMSIAMILRAIIDHVPPIFGLNSFAEVSNNYSAPKSFKEAMQHLESSLRKVADAHLHVQIRSKEVLPEFPQVDFRSPVDLLLAEIIRLLKVREQV